MIVPFFNGLLDGEQGLAGDPAVLHCLPPALTVFADADNDIEAVVAGVQPLTVALGSIANEGEGVIFEIVLELRERPVTPLVNDLLGSGKVESLDTACPRDSRPRGLGSSSMSEEGVGSSLCRLEGRGRKRAGCTA